MRARWWIALAAVGAAVAVTAVAVTRTDAGTDDPNDGTEAVLAAVEKAVVERRDLVESEEFAGELGYGPELKVSGHGAGGGGAGNGDGGVITALPALGSTIDRGEPLWEVDGAPGPRLLFGERPMWRELRRGVDDGADVRQLEENLVALGYAPTDMVVDEEFDADTATAIKAWQEAQGVDETGAVELSDVVFAGGELRVASHTATVGGSSDGEVLGLTGLNQIVTLAVAADDVDRFEPGDEPVVELPDGSRVDGVVWSIADVATPDPNGGDTTIEVVVALLETTDAYDAAPVEVVVTTTIASGVLTVPFRALLALSEGGYAVEKVTGSGTQLVGVELGSSGDGVIEITGDIAEGDEVVVSL
ncbi:MAG TPA: peptidoglycan-binding domain-containing protein [Ilumatobacteraceae bacterium]|nr:peptidoglycan-binding domain-containing protein [Ilumatobacteraceae bacterium]